MCNREGRYDDALRIARQLQEMYPRNRLFWLEAGSTALRAGRAAEALRELDEGFARFGRDPRPKAYREEEQWQAARARARTLLASTQQRKGAEPMTTHPRPRVVLRLMLAAVVLVCRCVAMVGLRVNAVRYTRHAVGGLRLRHPQSRFTGGIRTIRDRSRRAIDALFDFVHQTYNTSAWVPNADLRGEPGDAGGRWRHRHDRARQGWPRAVAREQPDPGVWDGAEPPTRQAARVDGQLPRVSHGGDRRCRLFRRRHESVR